MVSISTHNGSTVSLAHNNREKWMVEKENKAWAERHPEELRIDLSKEHEIWHSEDLKEVYDKLFGEALKEWNSRMAQQGKSDRMINNYLSEIRAKENQSKNGKHPIYEIIYAIGNRDNPIEVQLSKAILKEIADRFRERNPNLYVVNMAYHADESGVPHLHVSYVPFADCNRGMSVQNSLSAALKQQGLTSSKYGETAQIKWQKQENQTLEAICNKHGIEVKHEQAGTKQEHLTVEEYKLQKSIDEKQSHLQEISNLPLGTTFIKKGRLEQLEEKERLYEANKGKIDKAERDIKAATETMKAYVKGLTQLQKDREQFDEKVNEAANRKVDMMKDKAIDFIQRCGLWESFNEWKERQVDKLAQGSGIKK